MTLRVLVCIECDRCHNHFEKMVSNKGIDPGEISEAVHLIVLDAESDEWECRKNATEHLCDRCIESIHNPF